MTYVCLYHQPFVLAYFCPLIVTKNIIVCTLTSVQFINAMTPITTLYPNTIIPLSKVDVKVKQLLSTVEAAKDARDTFAALLTRAQQLRAERLHLKLKKQVYGYVTISVAFAAALALSLSFVGQFCVHACFNL